MPGFKRFTDIRAWQACTTYKQAVYRLISETTLAADWDRRRQLEQSVAGPPANIAEGFGRFNPADFAKFVVIARASIMESQSHLMDAVDTGHITEETRRELNALAEAALRDMTGLIEYLQSSEALQKSRRAKERRAASRPDRRAKQTRRTGN